MLHRYVKLLEISQFSNKFSFRILIRKDTHSGCNFCSGGGVRWVGIVASDPREVLPEARLLKQG